MQEKKIKEKDKKQNIKITNNCGRINAKQGM
jgi:hypothetical protein